jgi:hypothetical protein
MKPSSKSISKLGAMTHACNPTTQEAEIRKTAVQSQLGKIVHEKLSGKKKSPKGLMEWLKV